MRNDTIAEQLSAEHDAAIEAIDSLKATQDDLDHNVLPAALSRVYKFGRFAQQHQSEFNTFLKQHGVKAAKAGSLPFLSECKLLFRKQSKQSWTGYAKCLNGMLHEKVAEEDAETWLREGRNIGRKNISGLAKGIAAYNEIPSVKDQRESRKANRQIAKDEKILGVKEEVIRLAIAEGDLDEGVDWTKCEIAVKAIFKTPGGECVERDLSGDYDVTMAALAAMGR